jgi:hypothetical protein
MIQSNCSGAYAHKWLISQTRKAQHYDLICGLLLSPFIRLPVNPCAMFFLSLYILGMHVIVYDIHTIH